MNVFISWSGPRSRSFALIVHDWLLAVVQAAKPWMSDRGIGAGERWNDEISSRLKDTNFGIICLTPGNLAAPWLLFEAGALAKAVESARVVPVLLGMKRSDLKYPLAQFQSVLADKDGMFELAASVNRALGDRQLTLTTLNSIFNALWDDLEEKILTLPPELEPVSPVDARTDRDLLEEISDAVRSLQRGGSTLAQSEKEEANLWEEHYIRGVNLANSRSGDTSNAGALLEYSKAIALAPFDLQKNTRSRLYAYRGAMFKRLNRFDEAEADIRIALNWATEARERDDASYNMACIEAMTSRHQQAITRLKNLISGNRKWTGVIANVPYFSSLREKPEFAELIREA